MGDKCQWCGGSNESIPMIQGGTVHLVSACCGSGRGCIGFSEFRSWYMKLRKENFELRAKLEELEGRDHG